MKLQTMLPELNNVQLKQLKQFIRDLIGEDEGTLGGTRLTYNHEQQARDALRAKINKKLEDL